MDDIPDDYELRHDEALERAEDERVDDYVTRRGDCPGVDPFEEDSDEELDTEADDDDAEEEDPSRDDEDEAELEGGPAEPLAVEDDVEEEDPSEEEEDDIRHAEEAPVEPVPVEVPLEAVHVEAPAELAPTEVPEGDEVVWIDREMYPQVAVPASPPISPIASWGPVAPESPRVEVLGHPPETPPESPIEEMYSDDEPEMGGPLDDEDSERTISDPDLQAPPPVPIMTVYEHDLILAHSTAQLVVAHARVDELRLQVIAVTEAGYRAHRRYRRGVLSVHRALRSVHHIERRALSRMRSLTPRHRRKMYRDEAIRVVTRSMSRVRRVIRRG